MKSNRLPITALLLCGLVLGLSLPAAAQERTARTVVVNLERVFNEYHKTRRADAQLKSQAEEFNTERQQMVAQLEAAQKEFTSLREDAQNPALTEEARSARRIQAEEKVLSIRELEAKIKEFEEMRSKHLESQSRRMRRGLVEEIRDAIRAHARTRGYDLVLDVSGNSLNGVELVLFADPRVDITTEVLEKINQAATAPAEGGVTP
ncbi:MAG: OmpH family outer membrane protein [Kiritimatiellia bacterium]|nr:OmpH family outer membrane protein [Kiritimatiellia bacterium]